MSPVIEQSVQRFNERAAREPRTWEKAVLLFLAVATPIWLGSERGVGARDLLPRLCGVE